MKEPNALRPGRPAGPALRSFGREIIADARGALEPAQVDAVAVHEFRRAMKRWRAFLRLLAPSCDGAEPLRLAARDHARALGVIRDTQAALDALRDLGDAGGHISARSLEAVRSRVDARMRNSHHDAFAAVTRARLLEFLESAATSYESWPVEAIGFKDLANALASTYRRARRARPADWTAATAPDLHELRRRVIEHRYQMELMLPLWPRLGRLWVEEAQRLRTRLGAYHDLVVLDALLEPAQPLARWRARLRERIATRQAEHVAAAQRLATRLFAERPRAFHRRLHGLWDGGE